MMRFVDRLAIYFFHPRSRLRINSYFFSFLYVLVTFLIGISLISFLSLGTIFLLFIIPIILSSAYGGFLPGIFTTLLCIIGISFFLTNPVNEMLINMPLIWINSILFLVIAVFISLLSEARNIFEKKLDDAIITEQLAKRNAEQQIRIREHFISVASHELKSPITAQKANLQLVKNLIIKDHLHSYLPYIDKTLLQTDKITNFINDLLDVSKMNSRKLHYRFSFFTIKEALNDAIDQVQNLLVSHTIEISGKSSKKIYGDKERISQVLTNLLSNAIKYSPEKTEINVKISENKNNLQISVQDFGIGVEESYKEKIFNRFFRVSGNDESNFKGFGLGLYLTAEIIKKHKGKIWVESEIGKGSIFIFTLPLKKVIHKKKVQKTKQEENAE